MNKRKILFLKLLRLNPTDDEVELIKREIDEDESGEIDFEEFLEIMNCRTLRLAGIQNLLVKYIDRQPYLD